jgi:hypothetical protein
LALHCQILPVCGNNRDLKAAATPSRGRSLWDRTLEVRASCGNQPSRQTLRRRLCGNLRAIGLPEPRNCPRHPLGRAFNLGRGQRGPLQELGHVSREAMHVVSRLRKIGPREFMSTTNSNTWRRWMGVRASKSRQKAWGLGRPRELHRNQGAEPRRWRCSRRLSGSFHTRRLTTSSFVVPTGA